MKAYLFTVAYRLTGSASDAEDMVQDAWIRYLDAGAPMVDSLRAYLTTIVSRLSLDYLKSARVRREQYVGSWLPEPVLTSSLASGLELGAETREAVSMAMLTLLDRLTPDQRVVYVLRESYDTPYEEIAPLLSKLPSACRQIHRRAAIRMKSTPVPAPTSVSAHKRLIPSLVQALESGDIAGLAALLQQDAVWISDAGPEQLAARRPVFGADRISRGIIGVVERFLKHGEMRLTVEDVNGEPAVLVWENGHVTTVLQVSIVGGQIANLWFSRNPRKLAHLTRGLPDQALDRV